MSKLIQIGHSYADPLRVTAVHVRKQYPDPYSPHGQEKKIAPVVIVYTAGQATVYEEFASDESARTFASTFVQACNEERNRVECDLRARESRRVVAMEKQSRIFNSWGSE